MEESEDFEMESLEKTPTNGKRKSVANYILSDNRITQNYLAFSCITGNSKQDFTLTKKSKF